MFQKQVRMLVMHCIAMLLPHSQAKRLLRLCNCSSWLLVLHGLAHGCSLTDTQAALLHACCYDARFAAGAKASHLR